MIKFNEVKLTYNCPAAPPQDVFMDRIYTINKDNKGFFFTDGNYVEYVKESDLWYIKMLFSPNNVKWEDVDFSEGTVKIIDKTVDKIVK